MSNNFPNFVDLDVKFHLFVVFFYFFLYQAIYIHCAIKGFSIAITREHI